MTRQTRKLADDGEVVFPDKNLEAAIREVLGKAEGTLTRADLTKLDRLTTYIKGRTFHVEYIIKDLLGLEHAADLTELVIIEGQISDLSPLSSLPRLTIFGVITHLGLPKFRGQISDLGPLSFLTNLTALSLPCNRISDISPLASLTNLKQGLILSDNQISDISPLASLTKLTELQLSDNQISDISPLASLTKLDYIELARNPLGREAIDVYAPMLESRGVGVNL